MRVKASLYKYLKNITEYILVTLIILNCNSVYVRIKDKNYYIKELVIIFSIIILFLLIYMTKINKKTFQKNLIFICIYGFLLTIFVAYSVALSNLDGFIIRYYIFIPIMVICFQLYEKREEKFKLFYRYSDIMIILAISSILFWYFCSILNVVNPNSQVVIQWENEQSINSYKNLYFETQTVHFLGFFGYRNTGIFTEGPMFSLCLCVSLIVEIFMKNIVSKKRCCVLIATIITTFSTTGMISCLIILFLAFIFKNSSFNKRIITLLKWFTIPIIMLSVAMLVYNLILKKSTTISYSIRIDDYIAGFKAWLDHPIIGNGYGDESSINAYMSSFRNNNLGFSNSIMNVLAQGGILFFFIYFYPIIYVCIKSFKSGRYNILCIIFIFIILFCTTIFQERFLCLLFISMFYSFLIKDKEFKY